MKCQLMVSFFNSGICKSGFSALGQDIQKRTLALRSPQNCSVEKTDLDQATIDILKQGIVAELSTGLSMRFDKIHSKDAIST